MQKNFETDFPTEIIKEGKIQLLVPKLEFYGVCPSDYAPSKAPVFYNPVMEFNRDVSVIAFQSYQRMISKDISICEPLTATGVRGIRFAAEIQGVKYVVASDINLRSAKVAEFNIALNNLQDKVILKNEEANHILIEHSAPKERFDVIDIDPFGTPVPHIDSAVQALRNKGLLATTATDMAPLCGVHPKACQRKYGGRPLRTEYCKELAVRLLAGSVATMAAKHDIGTQVLFSQCSDHYIRVYSQIDYGAQKADLSLKKMGYVLHCFNCLHREIERKPFSESAVNCSECGGKLEYAGPLWIGEMFNAQFTDLMLKENERRAFKNNRRIKKFLSLARLEADTPATYYVLDKMGGKYGLPAPSVAKFFEALRNLGYEAVGTHFDTRGVRSVAPASVMREALLGTVKPLSQ